MSTDGRTGTSSVPASMLVLHALQRLPIFFLLDCSLRLAGELNVAVQDGIDRVSSILRSHSAAARLAYLSATAAQDARLSWLDPVLHFNPPALDPIGPLALAPALLNLHSMLYYDIVDARPPDRPGDLPPLIFLVLGDAPDDEDVWRAALAALRADHRTNNPQFYLKIVALLLRADLTEQLSTYGVTVVRAHPLRAETIAGFFEWAADLIIMECEAYTAGGMMTELPPLPYGVMWLA